MTVTQNLYELFVIDQQVRGLSRRLNAAAGLLRTQQSKLEQLQRQLAEVSDQVRHAEASAANSENESNAIGLRIEKLREQMNTAKSNKEYSAMLVEVNTIKADKSKAEEFALQQMGKAEQLRALRAELQAKIAEQEKVKHHAEEQLAARRNEVGDQLAQVKAKRESAARLIPEEMVCVFDKLSEATDGEALAEVARDGRFDDYHCGGCFMALPMERVNQLATSDKLVRCPSCTRILFLASETREAISGK